MGKVGQVHRGIMGRTGLVLAATAWIMIQPAPPGVLSAGVSQGPISVNQDTSRGGMSSFNMEFRDADLKDVLRALGQESGFNVIIGEEVNGRLTLSFQRVTADEAFDAILKINNLISFRDGSIIRVVASPFSEVENNLTTEIIPVNFSDAKESAEIVKALLSQKGSVAVDTRTNSLIVRDLPDSVAKIAIIVKSLDGRTPQILIEARIVEASRNFARELGIQWGGNFVSQTTRGQYRVTGATRNTGVTTVVGGGSTTRPMTGGIGLSGSDFVVNLPATVTEGVGGALGFTFGNVASTRQLDIQLSAMEDTGKGRILSNPRVLTMNNKEARISSGTEIFIQSAIVSGATTGGTGTSTGGTGGRGTSGAGGITKIDAKLELAVTPHVTPDNQIMMHVRADKKEPDYNRQVQNIPPLVTRSIETDLLVGNGETIVIGGIFTRNEAVSQKGIPWLSRIPVLGWLFKKEVRVDNENELLIFITPTIQK